MLINEQERSFQEWLDKLKSGESQVFEITYHDGQVKPFVNGTVYGGPFNRQVALFGSMPEGVGQAVWINDVTLGDLKRGTLNFVDGRAQIKHIGPATEAQFVNTKWSPFGETFKVASTEGNQNITV